MVYQYCLAVVETLVYLTTQILKWSPARAAVKKMNSMQAGPGRTIYIDECSKLCALYVVPFVTHSKCLRENKASF